MLLQGNGTTQNVFAYMQRVFVIYIHCIKAVVNEL